MGVCVALLITIYVVYRMSKMRLNASSWAPLAVYTFGDGETAAVENAGALTHGTVRHQ